MKVERWTTCDEVDERSMPESIGGMGGWVHGHTWYEYLDAVCLGKDDPKLKYYQALRESIVEGKIRCGGDEHQQSMTPVFDDGTVGSFSFRAWGDLMAAIWNTEENTNKYSYMDFYMGCLVDTARLIDRNKSEVDKDAKEENQADGSGDIRT